MRFVASDSAVPDQAGSRALASLLIMVMSVAVFGISEARSIAAASIECATPATPAATAAATTASSETTATSPVAFPRGGDELTVFAAASLTDAFNQMKTDLEAANEGLAITYNFAGSQALVTQLAEGAEADVFASASKAQMDAAIEKGVIEGTPQTFTQNRLAIAVPKDNPAGVQGVADLAKPGLKLVLAAAEVPVGQYARQSICKADADPATYGEGFVEQVAANVVSEEDNVRAVLAKIQLGEADAGIVYSTDVTPDVAGAVALIEIPAAVNVVAKYPIAAVKGSNAELAQAFIDYVLGPDGQATLQRFGFGSKP